MWVCPSVYIHINCFQKIIFPFFQTPVGFPYLVLHFFLLIWPVVPPNGAIFLYHFRGDEVPAVGDFREIRDSARLLPGAFDSAWSHPSNADILGQNMRVARPCIPCSPSRNNQGFLQYTPNWKNGLPNCFTCGLGNQRATFDGIFFIVVSNWKWHRVIVAS